MPRHDTAWHVQQTANNMARVEIKTDAVLREEGLPSKAGWRGQLKADGIGSAGSESTSFMKLPA